MYFFSPMPPAAAVFFSPFFGLSVVLLLLFPEMEK
jgi:hypothetical protein